MTQLESRRALQESEQSHEQRCWPCGRALSKVLVLANVLHLLALTQKRSLLLPAIPQVCGVQSRAHDDKHSSVAQAQRVEWRGRQSSAAVAMSSQKDFRTMSIAMRIRTLYSLFVATSATLSSSPAISPRSSDLAVSSATDEPKTTTTTTLTSAPVSESMSGDATHHHDLRSRREMPRLPDCHKPAPEHASAASSQSPPQPHEQHEKNASARDALQCHDNNSASAPAGATSTHTMIDDSEEKTRVHSDSAPAATDTLSDPLQRTLTMELRIDTGMTGHVSPYPVRLHELKHSHSTNPNAAGVGAPPVWISPDWATYPIIENFYGQPRRTRVSSFYEVMCSPTNVMQTTTLAENCCAYDHDDSDRGDTAGAARRLHALDDTSSSNGATPAQAAGRRRRKHGSFSYSCSTETSDDVDVLPSPFALDTLSGDAVHWRHRRSRAATDDAPVDRKAPPTSGSGFAAWNRIRRTVGDGTELVPVPVAGSTMHLAGARGYGNPQAGSTESSPTETVVYPESPPAMPPTTSRLRFKLNDSLAQIDARIERERALVHRAQANVSTASAKEPTGAVWQLFCGAKPFAMTQTDGLVRLHEQLSVAVHTRALNQLQRHRRHVNGILQIVTSHNPDLELTEKQLDSFESADAMLANDIKHSVLEAQVASLAASIAKRKDALAHAKARNGPDCFEHARVKSAMLTKLLEAVSWYRLVQTNAREEAASCGVAAPTEHDATALARSLQEVQVEKILRVLDGEAFYSDYNELMCSPEWWAIAQAHFENLVFAKADSRICQWMHRLASDVAAVSYEALDDASGSSSTGLAAMLKPTRVLSERRQSFTEGARSHSARMMAKQQQQSTVTASSWANDPQPEQLLDFLDRLTRRIRREFDVPHDVSKSLNCFVQRAVFPRVAVLCFSQKATRECQRKDKLWRKKCSELSGVAMEQLNVPSDLAATIRSQLPSRRTSGTSATRGQSVYLIRAIDAFNRMASIVPCDLLDELMHGVVILHHEAALVLGTTQFSVETFFPLLAYVLLHCHLPRIHAQLHLLEHFAITHSNVNGEESYYVYCVHAAVEFICNSAGLSVAPAAGPTPSPAAKDDVSTHSPLVRTAERTTASGRGAVPAPDASAAPVPVE